MSKILKLGIRQLAEFCCRSGDLGYEGGPGVKALEGLRTHQAIQKRYQKQAVAEHRIQFEINIDDYQVELGGRIDLLFDKESPPRVEEIKTIYSLMNKFSENYDEPHWAQAKCYAACYALENNINTMGISLNYVNLFNHQEHRQNKTLSTLELEAFLHQILHQYLSWFRLIETQQRETLVSAKSLEFPHDNFRRQQHALASHVYRNIQQKNQLMVEAPTGSGKTISTLFPSVKAIGENLVDQIVFLSAKTSGQNQAVNAIEHMIAQGLQISYLVIQAKAKCCPCGEDNSPDINDDGKCIRTLGFFDRLAAAREQLVKHRHLNPSSIRRIANEFQLCPFELSLQMLPWVDIVIADLNYVFDPLVQLSYFKTDNKRKVLLVDELHNLVDRARGMYSAKLSRQQIKQALESNNSSEIIKAINKVGQALDKELRAQAKDELVSEQTSSALAKAISRFGENLGLNLFNNKHVSADTLAFAKDLFRYQSISQLYDKHHRTIGIKPLAQRQIKLLCLNANEYLREIYPLFHSVCGFSATLTPSHYFLQALGYAPEARALRLDSCFPEEHLQVNICSYVDIRYRQRDDYIDQICATIQRCFNARPGNYLVFFSSYAFMHKVHDRFHQLYASLDTMLQSRTTDDAEREIFLDQFKNSDQALGFAIMGGVFAEGIDYQGESLIGAIVVGVGMPQANTEQQLIQQDFENMGLNGFDFAYQFPGLTRVQQSAGRVIRSETDKGVVILLDRRFSHQAYRAHYPTHWQPRLCQSIDSFEESLKQFWATQNI